MTLVEGVNLHLGELGRSTAGDLLDTEGNELILQLIKLLREILLGLGPQLSCFYPGLHASSTLHRILPTTKIAALLQNGKRQRRRDNDVPWRGLANGELTRGCWADLS
jgi:hypothetical protein